MEEKTKNIAGFKVFYDDATKKAIEHLYSDLSADEARVFFEYARRHKTAQFEDDEDRNFTLTYKGDNQYLITRRS